MKKGFSKKTGIFAFLVTLIICFTFIMQNSLFSASSNLPGAIKSKGYDNVENTISFEKTRASSVPINQSVNETKKTRIAESYGKLPLYFIKNDGQIDSRVKYYEKGSGHTTFFTEEGVYLSLTKNAEGSKTVHSKSTGKEGLKTSHPEPVRAELVKLTFAGANRNPEVIANGQQEGRVNYFIGNDPRKWKTNTPDIQGGFI